MEYKLSIRELAEDSGIAIVGCGGTGGFVAEGLCRLLGNKECRIILIDHDRVEPHNLRRQAFYEHDLGKFKSQALAERLSRLYGRQIMYSVYPYTRETVDQVFVRRYYRSGLDGIIIGCVDNPQARKSIADSERGWGWWIDAGNGEKSGQVLIGNVSDPENLKGCFHLGEHTVERLPMPTMQQPDLLKPVPASEAQGIDCAEAVEANVQSPVINQTMSSLVLEFVSKLLAGKLTWMGVYLDLEMGTLRPVPADPKTVARMVGVRVDQLMCKRCGKEH